MTITAHDLYLLSPELSLASLATLLLLLDLVVVRKGYLAAVGLVEPDLPEDGDAEDLAEGGA